MTKIDQLAGQQAGQQNFSDFQERTVSEPLFKGAHQALTYAFNYSSGTLDRPAMVKMADRTPRTGRGLAGVDGAAQAGFILRELQALAPLHQRILEARFLPQTTPCPCCRSSVWDQDWFASVRAVSDLAMACGVLSGHVVHRAVRDGIVARYFVARATAAACSCATWPYTPASVNAPSPTRTGKSRLAARLACRAQGRRRGRGGKKGKRPAPWNWPNRCCGRGHCRRT